MVLIERVNLIEMEYICLYFGAINVLITGDGKVFKMIIGSDVILDVAEMKYNDKD